jgi:hypothetical protein
MTVPQRVESASLPAGAKWAAPAAVGAHLSPLAAAVAVVHPQS